MAISEVGVFVNWYGSNFRAILKTTYQNAIFVLIFNLLSI